LTRPIAIYQAQLCTNIQSDNTVIPSTIKHLQQTTSLTLLLPSRKPTSLIRNSTRRIAHTLRHTSRRIPNTFRRLPNRLPNSISRLSNGVAGTVDGLVDRVAHRAEEPALTLLLLAACERVVECVCYVSEETSHFGYFSFEIYKFRSLQILILILMYFFSSVLSVEGLWRIFD
jgi:hypothetical protein